MTQEEKELLLKDLCARLPYGVKILFGKTGIVLQLANISQDHCFPSNSSHIFINKEYPIQWCKPYLRPMSSMTEVERKEENKLWDIITKTRNDLHYLYTDFLLSHHLDYRGLIPMGLAIEAPEDMYKIE